MNFIINRLPFFYALFTGRYKYIADRVYRCHKCRQQIPVWIVKYFAKESRKKCETLDNFVAEKGKIFHINCKRTPLKDGTTCIICEREIGKRAICEECLKVIENDKIKTR